MSYTYLFTFMTLWYSLLADMNAKYCNKNARQIAIIGGGIGGTSCAYFLRELFREEITIDLYEAEKIGGRLSLNHIEGECFEAGGAIIHPRNKYMKNFADRFGLKVKTPSTSDLAGLYDGNEFRFVETQSLYMTYLKLIWRYGMDLFRLKSDINMLLDKFENIYIAQENNQSFTNVHDLLHSMGPEIPMYLVKSVEFAFEKEKKYNEKLIKELVYATIRVNYGQNNLIHQFVGSVSVAGAENGLWYIDGGNKQVPENLLQNSGARLLNTTVHAIELAEETQKFNILCVNHSKEYDSVIIAAPITSNSRLPIEFLNFPKKIFVPGRYFNTICTFVTGIINHTHFGYDNFQDLPSSIFAVNDHLYYSSITLLKFNETKSVYKVFSRSILSDEQLNTLFGKILNVEVIDWLAYPHYSTQHRNDSFVLYNNLYHINAVEWAASAIEMSLIGSKNVALLVNRDLKKEEYKKDNINRFPEIKIEL